MLALFSLSAGVFVGVAGIVALIFGGHRERTAALFCLGGVALTQIWVNQRPQDAPIPYLIMDMAVLAGLVSLCWKAPRSWPLWASGLKLFSVMAAVTILRNPELTPQTFLILWWALNIGVVFTTAMGAVQNLRLRPKQPLGQRSDL